MKLHVLHLCAINNITTTEFINCNVQGDPKK